MPKKTGTIKEKKPLTPRWAKLLSDIEALSMRFPVAEISRKTGFTKGNVSEILNQNREPSENFLTKFYEQFPVAKPNSDPNNDFGVPVYDVEFSAGTALSILESRDVAPVIARLSLPEVVGCDAIIRARGNSMSDFIDDRDWIGIKMISDWDVLMWGYPYAVVTDELEVIKYISKCKASKNILLVSHNKTYPDVELSRDKIRQLFLVKVVLPFSKVKTII